MVDWVVNWVWRLQPVTSKPDRNQSRGVLVASGVLGIWAISTTVLLSLDWEQIPWSLRGLGFLWQMFLYTGLFVTAHDAMHGSIAPHNRQLNNCIGQVALFCYAMFPFKKMAEMHHLHHAIPARSGDPDYHNGRWSNFFGWYAQFMVNYWSWMRLVLLIGSFHALHQVLQIAEANLTWFWVVPSVASSFQLFFFGTFLPHREPKEGYQNDCHARSTPLSEFWSFITCYHFGYHEEHHEMPHLAWWQLPTARRLRLGS
ncbi:fatty acid desaturase [Alkalinema sp. FACHB-956]|uniref:fatty acid desaturase n=1 Tax=Alkalinema sp. FACHB-956 TaxID=2692768 RepID=UPI00168A37F4|nr:fatty acid desaturase [Alkalinema sp. FACHB-956]MBD2329746.1 fatty acid desaturase [Alkalinema sp. FACHB-956]